jgi:hypothetical protein
MHHLGIFGSVIQASLGWYQISTRNREYILIGAAVALVILSVLGWAVFIRKRDRHSGGDHHQHDGGHHHHRRRRRHRPSEPTGKESDERGDERRRVKRRHKHRREEERRNPTRAETGGLPGRRDADMPAS